MDKTNVLLSETSAFSRRATFIYMAVALTTLLAPIGLWRLPVPFIRLMDAIYHPIALLQLFVFCAAIALIGVGTYLLYCRRGAGIECQLPVLLAVLVFFHFLALLRQHAARSWDYGCYEQAAQAIVQGVNPYGACYLYLPTVAQTLAWLYQISGYGASIVLSSAPRSDRLWDLVFYLYEATQFFQLIVAYVLCYRLARRLALEPMRAGLLIAILFLFNNPLLATLKHNQVNLWVLNLLLLAILWLPRRPLLSGLCVALGGHIKLYPLILLLPWTLTRQWRALLAAAMGMIGLVLLQTKGGVDWQIWQTFGAFAGAFPKGDFFRDNSLHSLVYNSIGHLKYLLGDPSYWVNEEVVERIVLVAMGVGGLLYLARFRQRERSATVSDRNAADRAEDHTLAEMGHMIDAIALGLLISPVVWEHHYLLALPVLIWALANQETVAQLRRVGVSAFLIFVIPTFDIFPFSYHRLAGLLLLVATLPPVTAPSRSALHTWGFTLAQANKSMIYPSANKW